MGSSLNLLDKQKSAERRRPRAPRPERELERLREEQTGEVRVGGGVRETAKKVLEQGQTAGQWVQMGRKKGGGGGRPEGLCFRKRVGEILLHDKFCKKNPPN